MAVNLEVELKEAKARIFELESKACVRSHKCWHCGKMESLTLKHCCKCWDDIKEQDKLFRDALVTIAMLPMTTPLSTAKLVAREALKGD